MTHCTVLVSRFLGSFTIHYINSLHGPGTSIIKLKETISIAFLGTAWAVSLDQKGVVSLEMKFNGVQSAVDLTTSAESPSLVECKKKMKCNPA